MNKTIEELKKEIERLKKNKKYKNELSEIENERKRLSYELNNLKRPRRIQLRKNLIIGGSNLAKFIRRGIKANQEAKREQINRNKKSKVKSNRRNVLKENQQIRYDPFSYFR